MPRRKPTPEVVKLTNAQKLEKVQELLNMLREHKELALMWPLAQERLEDALKCLKQLVQHEKFKREQGELIKTFTNNYAAVLEESPTLNQIFLRAYGAFG